MNVLVLSDDGIGSMGLKVLLDGARNFLSGLRVVVVSTDKYRSGTSMSVTEEMGAPLSVVSGRADRYHDGLPDRYYGKGTLMDAVYSVMLNPTEYFPSSEISMALVGVNYGANVGVDVFHSGSVGVGMLLAAVWGLPVVALAQEVAGNERAKEGLDVFETYSMSHRYVNSMLERFERTPGVCVSVNFPSVSPKGYKRTQPADWSRWADIKVPGNTASRREDRVFDIVALQDGFVSVSYLELLCSSGK